MSLYSRFVLPRLIHWTCGASPQMKQRAKIVPRARGRVLEIGVGSGLNFPYYDRDEVSRVWGLDPASELRGRAREEAARRGLEVEFLHAGCEAIPLENGSVDTALVTYTLCSIPELGPALSEVARVLRPGGELLFCEHGRAPDPGVARWQERLQPVWGRLGGGCHLDRDIPAAIRAAGFRITDLQQMYVPGWRPASFNSWGAARPR